MERTKDWLLLIPIVLEMGTTESKTCLKDESLGDQLDINLYECNDPWATECCVVDNEPDCCQSESIKNLLEQLQLWGSIVGVIVAVAIIYICWRKDNFCGTKKTLKEKLKDCCSGRNKKAVNSTEKTEFTRFEHTEFTPSVTPDVNLTNMTTVQSSPTNGNMIHTDVHHDTTHTNEKLTNYDNGINDLDARPSTSRHNDVLSVENSKRGSAGSHHFSDDSHESKQSDTALIKQNKYNDSIEMQDMGGSRTDLPAKTAKKKGKSAGGKKNGTAKSRAEPELKTEDEEEKPLKPNKLKKKKSKKGALSKTTSFPNVEV
ncbi:unnamed protein product [Owenia fusiformis]|uniref:Uncharacterized protein n=1 Tax=Owenia fusiformis TaxID=6347 RepID=A0A8J1XWJ0_OWEFU|nr:unnamed protein product [Owenia fusiformis]